MHSIPMAMTLIYVAVCPSCDWGHQRQERPTSGEQIECACCGNMFEAEWQKEWQDEPVTLEPEDIEPPENLPSLTPDEAAPSIPPPLPPPAQSALSNQPRPARMVYGSARKYKVEPCDTGLLSGTLDASKLEMQINRRAAQGWRFVRSIHERRRVLVLFSREAHFLIFERDVD